MFTYEIIPFNEIDPDFHKSVFLMYSMCMWDLNLKPLPTLQYIKELQNANQGRAGKTFQCKEQIGGLFHEDKNLIQVKVAAVYTTQRYMAHECRHAWQFAQGGQKLKDSIRIRKNGSSDIERDAERYSERAIKAISYYPNYPDAVKEILAGRRD